MTDNTADTTDSTETEATDDWEPEPATLRDGETTDESHAARNLAQIRQGVEDGTLDEDALERAKRGSDDDG
jgi:hypothetical protein